MKCRHCHASLKQIFLDLAFAPPSNAYLQASDLRRPEFYYPLKVYVCSRCWLVQTEDWARPEELFRPDYAYFSSISSSWLAHASRYANMIIRRLGLGPESLVIEVGANDGYLLNSFVASGIPCLGIEPTEGTAATAEAQGVPILREFFGEALGKRLASERRPADLIIGNNVYAHVPDINDFTAGLKAALKPGGTITLEFPHLMRLIELTQFDTIYHEHFSYLSLYTVCRIFSGAGLRILDVEELPTHGGSLRVYGCHEDDQREDSADVARVLAEEKKQGLRELCTYQGFQARTDRVKDDFLVFLIEQKRRGRLVVAYGAAAKGNTLLNYAGVKQDLLPYVCDAAPSKQGKFLPGSHIPILPPEALKEHKPDVLLILPWNIAQEVMQQNAFIREWDGKFVTAVPSLREM
ncbi:class I SAM-dependent methyltransferase [Desulfovulcanus ferrireducens]|uniref:class I SAM-dependent methyltransferase n=1 Tax=Desulfovulcanus ferrireducens TaxID=2831190 RepID=UPI00207BB8AB|nr:class I SAM-dependent methyltransferase [Desulfovulcanus ferrireducens]